MIARRDLEPMLKRFTKFPVVIILGPRQSGKTTLAQCFFKNYHYVNLENPKNRAFVIEDPERFLPEYKMLLFVLRKISNHPLPNQVQFWAMGNHQ